MTTFEGFGRLPCLQKGISTDNVIDQIQPDLAEHAINTCARMIGKSYSNFDDLTKYVATL